MKRFLPALFFFVATTVAAQDLEIGKSQSGTLTADSKDTYTIEVPGSYFVYGVVNQLTVDTVAKIYDTAGKVMSTIDGSARGPASFQFSSDEPGTYTVEISSFEGAEGEYEIELVTAEPKAEDPSDLVDQVMTPFTGNDVPGVSVMVLKEGDIVFAKGYGMSNLTYDIPMDENTGMSIASVSKQFTGMAVMLMVAEGKMDLDEDIRTYIPELQDFGTPITLRNMLNHTSGYREIFNFLPMSGRINADRTRNEEPIYIVQRQAALQNEPGSLYSYNNTTFMLLARAVERVSGQDWKTYMEERIFKPLGMNNTTVKVDQGQVIQGSSQGYQFAEGGGYNYVHDLPEAYGASGVNTTALDIAKWMLNYRDRKVGGDAAIDAITTRGVLTTGDTTGYGLGLSVSTWRGLTRWSHTGGETAHRTYFAYLPDIESGLFISSANPAYGNGVAPTIAEAWFEEFLEPEEEPQADEIEADHTMPTTEQMEAIAGKWQFIGAPLQIVYSVEDGNMYAQATNQPRFEVKPTSDSTFTFVGVPASVTFHFEEDGTVTRATHHQGQNAAMEKVVAEPITVETLAEYEGRYYCEELETMYTLKVIDGKLMAHNRWVDAFPFTHVKNEVFAGGEWFLSSITFDRDPSGTVTGFMGGNTRTRNVWFERMK